MTLDGYNDKIIDDTTFSIEYFESISESAVKAAVKFLAEDLLKDLNVAIGYGKLSGDDYSYLISVRERPDGNFITQRVLELSTSLLYDLARVASEAMRTAVQIAYDVREILVIRKE
nr:MAG TPA: hypothetical protein [Caudoviricetes sp.]